MKIENNLLAISNVIFKEKENWKYVNDDQKEEFAFIINRFFSKMYPLQSQLLNHKNQDKVVLMNMWYHFQLNKPYPKWFWSKSTKYEKTILPDKDFKLLMNKMNINKEEDLIYMIEKFPDFIKEELKWFKSKIK